MLGSTQVFDQNMYDENFLEYDITNQEEMITMSVITGFDFILFYLSMSNFYKISRWYSISPQASPRRLICINSIILLLVGTRQVIHFYAIFGSLYSIFYINALPSDYVYFNVYIYSFGISMQSHLQNLTIFVSSKFWVKMILAQYEHTKERIDLRLLKYFISLGSFITLFSLFFLGIYNLLPIKREISIMMMVIRSYSTLITTLMSSLIFSISAKLFYQNLSKLNHRQMEQHSRKVKVVCCCLAFFQLVRVVFTILMMVEEEWVEALKKGGRVKDGVYQVDNELVWPVFMFVYILATDFAPSLMLLLLFQPQFQRREVSTSNSENLYD